MNLKELERISNKIIYNVFTAEIDTEELDADELADTKLSIQTTIANLQETVENLEKVLAEL